MPRFAGISVQPSGIHNFQRINFSKKALSLVSPTDNLKLFSRIFGDFSGKFSHLSQLPVKLERSTLTIDLKNISNHAEAEEILKNTLNVVKSFSPYIGFFPKVEFFKFELGERNLDQFLKFAISNENSDMLRVTTNNKGEHVFWLYNYYYEFADDKTFFEFKENQDIDKIFCREDNLGVNLQRKIAPLNEANLDIRIYTRDKEILDNPQMIKMIIQTVEREKNKLSYLSPIHKNEVIRIVLKADETEKYGCASFDHTYFMPLSFRKGLKYTKRNAIILIKGNYTEEDIATGIDINLFNENFRSYKIEYGIITLSSQSLKAELRHDIHSKISENNPTYKSAGTGIASALAEMIDDMQYIFQLSGEFCVPASYHNVNYRMPFAQQHYYSLAKNNSLLLFEWELSSVGIFFMPDTDGHKISSPILKYIKSLTMTILDINVLQSIEKAIFDFIINTKFRNGETNPSYGFCQQICEQWKLIQELKNQQPQAEQSLGEVTTNFVSLINEMLNYSKPHLEHKTTEKISNKFMNILKRGTNFNEETAIKYLAKEFGFENFNWLEQRELEKEIREKYPSLLKICSENLLSSKEIADKTCELSNKLKISIYRYEAPNGKTYATQLQYMLDPEVISGIIREAMYKYYNNCEK